MVAARFVRKSSQFRILNLGRLIILFQKAKKDLIRTKTSQLLHKSCHIQKTAKDAKKYIKKASSKNLQEPDEVKVSRPDLKTSGIVNDPT